MPLYYDCSFRYLHSPFQLTTVTEKSSLSVSHKWIQATFVRLLYGCPNCRHVWGSSLLFINERISAASQPASLGRWIWTQSGKLSQVTSLMFLPGTGRLRDRSDKTIRGSNVWPYFLTNWAFACWCSELFLRLVPECCRYLVEFLGRSIRLVYTWRNKKKNKLIYTRATKHRILCFCGLGKCTTLFTGANRPSKSDTKSNHLLRPVLCVRSCLHVHSVQIKSSGLKFRTFCSGSDVTYSLYHNSTRLTFSIYVHSWRFGVFYSLHSITPRTY